jgi:hypothetical protein
MIADGGSESMAENTDTRRFQWDLWNLRTGSGWWLAWVSLSVRWLAS